MKHLFLSIFILTIAASESSAQWKDFKFDSPAAFGVHNDTLFASKKGGNVYRYDPTSPDRWVIADTGLAPSYSDKAVTCFGSIGNAVLAGANATNAGYVADFRSINNGSSWTEILPRTQSNCFLTIGDTIYSGGAGGVYYSTDFGMNWTQFTNSQRGVNALAVLGTTLFEGTNAGVYFSTDNGQHWIQTSVTAWTNALAEAGSVIVAGLKVGGLYRSTDIGLHWLQDDTGLSNHLVSCLVTDGKNIFAGTGGSNSGSGVFLSTDSGLTWDTVNTGIPEGIDGFLNISTLFVYDTLLIAGATDNAGQESKSFVRSISEMVPKSAVRGLDESTLTLSAYPNPLSNSARISYSLPAACQVRIEVFDALGRSIATPLIGIFQDVGSHQIDLDARHLVPGIYWCRLTAGNRVQTTKLIIKR